MFGWMNGRRIAVLLFFAAACGLPVALDDYTLYRFTLIGISAIAIIGLNLLIGLSGQFSIGHGAFYAIGSYVMAIAIGEAGVSSYAAIPLAAAIGFVTGFLFGWPALRLGYVHLALATWGLAVAVPQLLKSSYLERWTGGVQGLYLDRPPAPFGLPLSEDQWWHLVTVVVLAAAIAIAGNLRQGRIGRALGAIRDNEIAAKPMGINVALYKSTIFGISAAYAGVAGALGALLTDFVAPDAFTVFFSIFLVVGAVVGGIRSVWGAIFGGFLIQFLPDLARNASGALSFPAYGLILLGLVYVFPDGVAGTISRIQRKFGGRGSGGL
jgi:branched-chain amino acid transport system permease protein